MSHDVIPIQNAALKPVGKNPNGRAAQRERNPYGLTDAQVQTMQALVNGYKQDEIARLLHVSPATVKERMYWIRLRMDVPTTLQAAVTWVREVEFGDGDRAAA